MSQQISAMCESVIVTLWTTMCISRLKGWDKSG